MAQKTSRPPQIRQTESGEEKYCPKCDVYHPADLDHFYLDSKSKTGLSSWCRACQRKSVLKPVARPADENQENDAVVETPPAAEKKDRVLMLDFSEHEILFNDLVTEAKEQLRTPEMQAMWLAGQALYRERSTQI